MLVPENRTNPGIWKELNMAHLVTLDMDELAGDLSPGLLADMQEARCDRLAGSLTGQHVRTGSELGQGWRREDFRQHAQGDFGGVVLDGQLAPVHPRNMAVSGHWLLGTVYGRDVLKAYLARAQPDLAVSQWRVQLELDVCLEDVITSMGLRDLPEPKTLHDRFQYFVRMSRTMLEIEELGRGLATG